MILADSGFWIALGNRRDRHHAAARAALDRYSAEGFVSTWPVLTEVTHLLCARASASRSAVAFIDGVARGACEIPEPPADALFARARADEPLPRPADGSCRCLAGDPRRGSRRRPHSVDRSARLRRLSLEEYGNLSRTCCSDPMPAFAYQALEGRQDAARRAAGRHRARRARRAARARAESARRSRKCAKARRGARRVRAARHRRRAARVADAPARDADRRRPADRRSARRAVRAGRQRAPARA